MSTETVNLIFDFTFESKQDHKSQNQNSQTQPNTHHRNAVDDTGKRAGGFLGNSPGYKKREIHCRTAK